MMTVCFIIQCVFMVKFNQSIVSAFNFACIGSKIGANQGTVQSAPFQGFRGCFLTGSNTLLAYDFVMWLFIDVSTCLKKFFVSASSFLPEVVLALITASALKECTP
jgi:hypothetical protein